MTPRLAKLAVAALLLGGCAMELPFECRWTLPIVAPAGDASVTQPLDLSSQEELWSERSSIVAVQLDSVLLTIGAVGERNRAESIGLAVRIRPEGAPETGERDLTVFPWLELPLEVGAATETPAPPEVAEAVMEALRGSGQLTLIVEKGSRAPVDATVELSLTGSARVRL